MTPLPPYRALSPSLSSTASFSPVEAPDGTAARPKLPSARTTSASTVGLPRESRISRPLTSTISVMNNSFSMITTGHKTEKAPTAGVGAIRLNKVETVPGETPSPCEFLSLHYIARRTLQPGGDPERRTSASWLRISVETGRERIFWTVSWTGYGRDRRDRSPSSQRA